MSPLLEVRGLDAWYGDFQALFGVELTVGHEETIAVIGANGAGKSTLLKAVCGQLGAPAEAILFESDPIGGRPAFDVARRGIAMVPEGRLLFPSLSVEENLLMGACTDRTGEWDLERVYALFPVLGERRSSPGTMLSGGQQQMAAIGRALMANPKLLLCDELSLGLAPVVVRDLYAALPAVKAGGATVVIVEQDVAQALAAADRVYCLQEGRIRLSGRPAELGRERITRAYFGT